MTAFEKQLEADRKLARDARLRFSVLAKESATTPWKTKGDRFDDLSVAFGMVQRLRAERCAIHVESDGKGLLYWTSDAPTELSSHVLIQGTSEKA
jgi:hypothetical protein